MQNVAATTTIVNDIGLVSAEQIPAFRAYLVESGLRVRDSGPGQFFHVCWAYSGRTRWLPIERGRAGAPVTPQLLRPLVDSFLKNPLDRAVGEVRAERQAAERVVARAALDLPRECAPVEPLALDPASGQDKSFEVVVCTKQGKSLEVIDIRKPDADAQYLSDLRDDFAVHAPTLAHFGHVGDLAELVRLRWEYADLMMAARTTKAGD